MYFVFEPIHNLNNSLIAFECLTRHKNPSSKAHDYYECFFKTATPEFLIQLAECQIDFVVENYAYFQERSALVNINVDIETLKKLINSKRSDLLSDYQLINFEIDLSRNFPADATCTEVLSLLKGRLWLDDASPANILLAADMIHWFTFIKIDKKYFWESQKSALATDVFRVFLSSLKWTNSRIVIEGVNCEEYASAMKELKLYAGQGFYWRTHLADEITRFTHLQT